MEKISGVYKITCILNNKFYFVYVEDYQNNIFNPKQKIKHGMDGKHHEDISKRNISLKKMPPNKIIHEYDNKNNFIKKFDCIFDIVSEYNLNSKSISAVLNNKRKSLNKKIFKYICIINS